MASSVKKPDLYGPIGQDAARWRGNPFRRGVSWPRAARSGRRWARGRSLILARSDDQVFAMGWSSTPRCLPGAPSVQTRDPALGPHRGRPGKSERFARWQTARRRLRGLRDDSCVGLCGRRRGAPQVPTRRFRRRHTVFSAAGGRRSGSRVQHVARRIDDQRALQRSKSVRQRYVITSDNEGVQSCCQGR